MKFLLSKSEYHFFNIAVSIKSEKKEKDYDLVYKKLAVELKVEKR